MQQQVAAAVLENFRELTADDVRSTSMGAPGMDVQLSARAQSLFPYAVECKACEKLSVYGAWEQCVRNARHLTPLLVCRKNRGDALAVVPLDHFLALLATPLASESPPIAPEAPPVASEGPPVAPEGQPAAPEAAARLGSALRAAQAAWEELRAQNACFREIL